jgi:hypothetical protein
MNHIAPPNMPEIADLDYPQNLLELIKQANAAFDTWAEADTAHAVAIDDLENAKLDFAAAIKTAATKGEPLPAPLDLAPLENAVIYAAEIVKLKKQAVNKETSKLREAFRADRLTIASLAIAKAEAGLEEYKTRMAEVAQTLEEIERNRRAAYDGLKMFSEYSGPEMRFSAEINAADTPRLPNTSEQKIKSVIANLKHVFFGGTAESESSELETETDDLESTPEPRPAAKKIKTA